MTMKASMTILGVALLVAAAACGCAARVLLDEPEQQPISISYEVMDTVGDTGIELRRYPAGTWVKTAVSSHDFAFLVDRGYEALSQYFEGKNFGKKTIPKTTPMFISFNLWDKDSQRYASFFVPEDNPPAPKKKVKLEEMDERFVYASTYNATMDFTKVCKSAARALVDLVLEDEPVEGSCDGDTVYIALYDYPPNPEGNSRPNEVIITRTEVSPFSGVPTARTMEFQ